MSAAKPDKIVLAILGPTGIGKTYLSRLLAGQLSVEIISADSRQIFKYLDIGTAKPAEIIRKEIPHHFVDILEPDQNFSAGEFGNLARTKIREIFSRGRIPLIVGGSGLYLKALEEGFFQNDTKDIVQRKKLLKRLNDEGLESLYMELAEIDPASAGKIHPNNSQRILRALEVFYAGGTTLSDLQKSTLENFPYPIIKYGLTKDRKDLYADINNRVDQMFADGLVKEVENILGMGYPKDLNSLNSVGYKEVIQYLQGKISLEEAVELIKRNSRRYAKRQYTWFNADQNIHWLPVKEKSDFSSAVNIILQNYNQRLSRGKK